MNNPSESIINNKVIQWVIKFPQTDLDKTMDQITYAEKVSNRQKAKKIQAVIN